MTTDLGRPRDPRIDDAVLGATVELLGETGYAGPVRRRDRTAGRHEQAGDLPALAEQGAPRARGGVPVGEATALPDTGSLADDVREMVRRTVAVLTTPAARAALPGLVGEMAADRRCIPRLLERFGDVISRGLTERLNDAAARGEVRPGVTAADVAEAFAGITLLALLTRATAIDDAWVERTATLITRGICA